ncbi:hypothetical protein IWW40_002633 [Coemansia sp. RSA 1250]|nr:hypothetical protein IWW40_002633 [Coemansia sp. RSA 1250]
MVCTVCHEFQFSAPTQPRGKGKSHCGKSNDTNNHPVALQCGHVFHRACIQEWFSSSERSECPLCHKTQAGPLLTLYVDEGIAEPQANGSKNNDKQPARKTTEGCSDNMDELYMQMLMLDFENSSMQETAMYGELMFYQQQLESLEKTNETLEEDLSDMRAIAESLNSDLEEANRLKEEAVSAERARADRLQAEVNRLTRVSGAHKRHIRSLQLLLEEKKELLRDSYIY